MHHIGLDSEQYATGKLLEKCFNWTWKWFKTLLTLSFYRCIYDSIAPRCIKLYYWIDQNIFIWYSNPWGFWCWQLKELGKFVRMGCKTITLKKFDFVLMDLFLNQILLPLYIQNINIFLRVMLKRIRHLNVKPTLWTWGSTGELWKKECG